MHSETKIYCVPFDKIISSIAEIIKYMITGLKVDFGVIMFEEVQPIGDLSFSISDQFYILAYRIRLIYYIYILAFKA